MITLWKVKLTKERATWYWFTQNPEGGGFGSHLVGPKRYALAAATRNIPEGATFELWVNHQLTGTQTKATP